VAEPAPRTAPVFGAPGIAGDRQVQYGFARSSAQAPADGELLLAFRYDWKTYHDDQQDLANLGFIRVAPS